MIYLVASRRLVTPGRSNGWQQNTDQSDPQIPSHNCQVVTCPSPGRTLELLSGDGKPGVPGLSPALLSVAVGPLPSVPGRTLKHHLWRIWSQKQSPKNAEMGDPQPTPPRPPFSGAQGSVLRHPWEPGDSFMMCILNFDK